ncbi:TIR domain-containing protein [Stenotrophomonas lactitubi]|uniref:TIR domain-containing protein n=1 Tax=Stenotrophomonas lactitubi TaxID=2045214 RepID=UPI0032080FBB
MGRKIFISYKYHDSLVQDLAGVGKDTTTRDYVDTLQALLDAEDNVNKGEKDSESLKGFTEEQIEDKLRDKIFDSSVTIVVLSPGMRDDTPEKEQWIPWEVAYSLRKKTRDGVKRKPNALLGVVLPDDKGSYDYHLKEPGCATCKCRTITRTNMFSILKNNLFNAKVMTPAVACASHTGSSTVYTGKISYMLLVSWANFVEDINGYIEKAVDRNRNWDHYNVDIQA